jgi:O-acetyl-ADP-ribose deacetylase (regulator of RNase III)
MQWNCKFRGEKKMATFSEKYGDLFDSSAPALAHGVNTAGLMGAGIAVEFRRRWPEMYRQYKAYCKKGLLKPGAMWAYSALGFFDTTTIFNIASQDEPGPHAKLDWLEAGLIDALMYAEQSLHINRIAMPRIGCGIGGLRWEDVREILEYYANTTNIDIEV